MEGLWSFLFVGGGKKVTHCIFGPDFQSLCTTIVSGIENYPSTCMSCCSDDLAQLLPCLDFWSLGSENISKFLPLHLANSRTCKSLCSMESWDMSRARFGFFCPPPPELSTDGWLTTIRVLSPWCSITRPIGQFLISVWASWKRLWISWKNFSELGRLRYFQK